MPLSKDDLVYHLRLRTKEYDRALAEWQSEWIWTRYANCSESTLALTSAKNLIRRYLSQYLRGFPEDPLPDDLKTQEIVQDTIRDIQQPSSGRGR